MSKPAEKAIVTKNKYRTHTCGQLRAEHAGEVVHLSGWVHSRRDHGGLIFIDLRDKWGITQLTFNPQKGGDFKTADTLRSEFVVHVEGKVVARPKEMQNPDLATGEIEIEVASLEILGPSKTPPFPIAEKVEAGEELRLQYRFLDLRHPRLQRMLKMRGDFIDHTRQYMRSAGFTEVQTPILANSSPEGARDFLVPSRLYPGKFYALPQAPQQFKQLLMVGGLDRYFQIAPCFRDEDPRADRHAGDFYQIDLEMSFVEQEDVFQAVEPLMVELTETFSEKKILEKPFPRITWHEAMTKYGSDKPDIRFELFISDVSDIAKTGSFKVFNEALKKGVVHALHIPGGAIFTRGTIDKLTEVAKQNGAGGLAYILVKEELTSPIIKHLGEDVAKQIVINVGAKKGDIIFFGAGSFIEASKALGAVRLAAAEALQLRDPKQAAWVWITDFPMYEYNEEEGKIDFSHNPFSMPQGGIEALKTKDPLDILGYQYDLALNGFEISSGAIRNHRPDVMYEAFKIAGYSKEEVDKKFGAMIKAFEYGTPPHGGCAPGIDRLLMILLNEPNIREIYAFPKDGKARDLMMNAPSEVDPKLLKDLHIKVESEK
ncbi:MAG: aspartate--tRNA ligase [Candidatus Andersenbacteria bacterium]|nr:aspartate--tRNA ligase [Candidatus Andersenbacteria bacterium]MBI3250431.1 aspartate--tRNA ligase [Candidatus Andersenbacteria bacterium]